MGQLAVGPVVPGSQIPLDLDKELIIINDGSSDGTRAALAPFESQPGITVTHVGLLDAVGGQKQILFSIQGADTAELDRLQFSSEALPEARAGATQTIGDRSLTWRVVAASSGCALSFPHSRAGHDRQRGTERECK